MVDLLVPIEVEHMANARPDVAARQVQLDGRESQLVLSCCSSGLGPALASDT